jgi:tRNA1(Val) A37 N6-methylase TrmN6
MTDFKITNDKRTTKMGKTELINNALVAVVSSNPKYNRVLKHTTEKKDKTTRYTKCCLHAVIRGLKWIIKKGSIRINTHNHR